MSRMIFVTLPVADLERSTAFYEAIGFARNPQFCDGTASCIVISETIYAMLLTHEKFAQFSPLPIADARKTCQVLNCLTETSPAAIDAFVATAEAAGARPDPSPKQDLGFMYGRSFADPDGHIWELVWMDPAVVAGETCPAAETADA